MDDETFDAILSDVAGGMATVRAVEAHNVHRMTFYRALDADTTRCDRYTRAKQSGLEAMADEILEIADDTSGDTYEDGSGAVKIAPDVVDRARLRIDSRKWLLSKLAPKKYGDKVELGGNVGMTVTLPSPLAGV